MTEKPKNVKTGVGKRPAPKAVIYDYDPGLLKVGQRRPPWFRFYRHMIREPAVVMLNHRQFHAWVVCLSVADENSGVLPPLRALSCDIRTSPIEVTELLNDLVEIGLVIPRYETANSPQFVMTGWTEQQFKTDRSGTERVRKHRESKRSKSTKDTHVGGSGDTACNVTCNDLERYRSESVFTVTGGRTKISAGDRINGCSPSHEEDERSARATLATDTDGGDR